MLESINKNDPRELASSVITGVTTFEELEHDAGVDPVALKNARIVWIRMRKGREKVVNLHDKYKSIPTEVDRTGDEEREIHERELDEVLEEAAEAVVEDEYTQTEAAKIMGVKPITFKNWLDRHPEVKTHVKMVYGKRGNPKRVMISGAELMKMKKIREKTGKHAGASSKEIVKVEPKTAEYIPPSRSKSSKDLELIRNRIDILKEKQSVITADIDALERTLKILS